MIEMRWKDKSRAVNRPIHEGVIGSPCREVVEMYRVLEVRRDDKWEELPVVGINED